MPQSEHSWASELIQAHLTGAISGEDLWRLLLTCDGHPQAAALARQLLTLHQRTTGDDRDDVVVVEADGDDQRSALA